MVALYSCRAPLLDVPITYFTVAPLFVGPIVAGFILGPMLGVFLIGMFTRRRGSDRGNMVAITAGLATTIVLGGLHVEIANLLSGLLRPTAGRIELAGRDVTDEPVRGRSHEG